MASQKNGTLYVGVTSDLLRRVYEHRNGVIAGFSERYDVKQLVWYQSYPTMANAIRKEKQLKKWERAWKLRLIESQNPDWIDLYPGLLGNQVLLDSRLRGNDNLLTEIITQ
jgi:putative endonuclease